MRMPSVVSGRIQNPREVWRAVEGPWAQAAQWVMGLQLSWASQWGCHLNEHFYSVLYTRTGLKLYVVNVSATSLIFLTVLMQRHGEVSGKAAGSLGVWCLCTVGGCFGFWWAESSSPLWMLRTSCPSYPGSKLRLHNGIWVRCQPGCSCGSPRTQNSVLALSVSRARASLTSVGYLLQWKSGVINGRQEH